MIQIEDLRKTYRSRRRDVVAVDGVDLGVRQGEIFGVLGQSGAGKSTLLRCVNLLERPDAGTVVVDGLELTALRERPLRAARRRVGMVHQHFALLSSRTAAGNVALPLEVTGMPRADRARRVAELLELVGLEQRAAAYPAQLSGGQKQRVGIARALAAGPQVLLSDEATSALDPETTGSILDLLLDLNRRLGLTILLITHEMDVVRRICHSAAVMRDGRFAESGQVADLLRRPGSELARGLFPLPPAPHRPGETVVDVTVSGEAADEPILAGLARALDLDVRILDGAVQSLAATRAGRLRIALPGSADDNAPALRHLRERGALAEVAA
ncbi:methionine ABC transporter ATP-binding protein [Amorphoplanes digitatis]|uniref:D-methionine transport system ATP-binding protein n=1 Tax=Actinoplanes digitatis TaxID=1868 RepID=A0A7W7MQH2_9ACTN|nr:ATP-binding cassette domain-containing protein [Actinoplanes digitatis]MBB4762697.1 D-methionine transport system ATP-binding protein [Actinoplanes digitatis]BFE71602.1 ATP-binding cassette domain-containing protein [Actinoplanes digitatis]GID91806.1 methionine import ATP-binding protein MetN [Actinoplanes digitatis]